MRAGRTGEAAGRSVHAAKPRTDRNRDGAAPPAGPYGGAKRCRSIGTPLSRGIQSPGRETALQGGSSPHTPAVARGHRATSPVRAETLFHLAFSGIAASPPSAMKQPKEGPSVSLPLRGGDRLTVSLFVKGGKVGRGSYRLLCKAARSAVERTEMGTK